MTTGIYSARYKITIRNKQLPLIVPVEATGYASIDAARDDSESQLRIAMREQGIRRARFSIQITVSNENGEPVHRETIGGRYEDGAIFFLD